MCVAPSNSVHSLRATLRCYFFLVGRAALFWQSAILRSGRFAKKICLRKRQNVWQSVISIPARHDTSMPSCTRRFEYRTGSARAGASRSARGELGRKILGSSFFGAASGGAAAAEEVVVVVVVVGMVDHGRSCPGVSRRDMVPTTKVVQAGTSGGGKTASTVRGGGTPPAPSRWNTVTHTSARRNGHRRRGASRRPR